MADKPKAEAAPTKKETSAKPGTVRDLKPQKLGFFSRVSPLSVALSIRHLSIMLKSGIAIDGAISILIEQAEDANLKKIFNNILIDIQNGVSLAGAMGKYPKVFSNIVTSIISVGEKGGSLESNLVFLSDYLKKSHELSKKVKGALIYPMIISVLTMVEMLGVIFVILPKLESLFSSFPNTPEYTKFILAMAKFVRENGLLILVVIIILFVLLNIFLGTPTGKAFKDRLGLSFPVVKLLNKNNVLTAFARTLAILLNNGIPLAKALEITADSTDNTVYKKILRQVTTDVQNGMTMNESLGKYKEYFHPTFTKMISIGEETGALEENLTYLYEFYADDVQEMSNNLASLLEPILLIFIGAMIGVLALIIIGPIYQLTGSING